MTDQTGRYRGEDWPEPKKPDPSVQAERGWREMLRARRVRDGKVCGTCGEWPEFCDGHEDLDSPENRAFQQSPESKVERP